MVDNKLKFHEQCLAVVAKTNKLLGIIHQSVNYTNGEMILHLYQSLVRPVMEYGNIIWDLIMLWTNRPLGWDFSCFQLIDMIMKL